jgi:hypothetical protein
VLTPPDGLPEAELASVLARGWGVTVTSLAYRAVGWGSHHWEAADDAGGRWFVTVDELASKRGSARESLDVAFGRLSASLAAAVGLRASGLSFVVAPVPALDGAPVLRAGPSFGVALYHWVDGRTFRWGEYAGWDRAAVLELLIAVHAAPVTALADDFSIPLRDELEAGLAGLPGAAGPFAAALSDLLTRHGALIRERLARYDALAAGAPGRAVLTHGEPHPGNTMLAGGRWLLIDWDTVLVAPPERDLWSLDPGDGSLFAAYAAATGVPVRPELIELYRVRWDLADLALDVSRFRQPHRGTPEDEKVYQLLCAALEG